MTTPMLQLALAPIVERRRRVRLLWRLAICWGVMALVALGLANGGVHFPAFLLALIAGLAAYFVWKIGNRWEPDYREIARIVEERHPELHALLATAVEQQPDRRTGQLHFLQQRVVSDALAESRKHSWIDAVPARRMAGAMVVQFALLFAFAFALTRLESATRTARSAVAEREGIEVTPGDVSVERGSGIVVLAKFGRDVPSEATLVLTPKNAAEQRMPLVKNLEDPVFGGGLPEVDADLSYRIEYAGKATPDFRVTVFEHPRLERADATLTYPAYTHLEQKQIPDTRRISAVEGSKLGVEFQLNKPVKSAKLIGKDKSVIPLTVDPQKAVATLKDFPLTAGETYELKLEDSDGRPNKMSAQLVVDVLANRRPTLKLDAPKGDQSVTALQEVSFKADAWDDFGMPAYGLSYTVAGQAEKTIVLGHDSKPDEKLVMEHMVKFEELSVKSDQLVSWHLWADDVGPDGKTRRTASDMFFAEVRPFEEIFREKEGGAGGQPQNSQQGNEAQQQANAQKQIIVATWNIKRAEDARGWPPPSEKYLKDIPVVRDAQEAALTKATAREEKIDDAKSKAFIQTATGAMKTALAHLNEATKTPAPLPEAVTAEQDAYNALLKLAAHEFQISRQQQSQGEQSAQQQQRQQELDQLELKDDKDRYESKREAQPQKEEQREQLAIFNRLKELAQRQGDINERLKELQTALQEAKTEKEKEELKRQLKRLREEEQQLLADMDEAKQKMEKSASASQMADERKKLEQTRGETQQAAESMEKNDASQALASGTRAQRQMQELRDEFRKKSAGQFNDDLRQMRTDARQLAQDQQEIADKLAEPEAKTQRTLDASSPREQLEKKFGEQQNALGGLREDMKDVSERAEGAEPLLSKELYDTLRKNTQSGTDETLKRAGQLATRGMAQEARKFEMKARQEIEDLKTGVERAAESVLGSEAEALRTARAELDAAARQLNREIAQADPAQAAPDEREGARDGESARPGDQPPRQIGEGTQPGEGQPRNAQAGTQPGANPRDQQPSERPGGKKPGESESGPQPGQNPGDGKQPGQGKPGGEQGGTQPGQGEQPGQGQEPGQGKPGGQQAGTQPGEGKQPGEGQQPGEGGSGGQDGNASSTGKPNGSPSERPGSRLRELTQSQKQRGGIRASAGGGGNDRGGGLESQEGPLSGDGFIEWSDRLRSVEEMLDEPKLRNEVARVREAAQAMRAEFKRHGEPIKWDLAKTKIGTPLAELRDRLTEELARRESREALVPIDRDPVPPKYSEHVRRYYEELGRSR